MPEQHLQRTERLAAVTQQVGFALWQLQALEAGAAQYVVLLVQATQGMGRTAGEALVEKAQGRTFGTTLQQLAKAKLLDDDLAPRFSRLLGERNWLVHRSRADSRGAIESDGAAQKLLRRIEAIADEAEALMGAIRTLAERFVRERGVSIQDIDAATQQLLQQWQNADVS